MTMWEEQLVRMERYYQRCRAIQDRESAGRSDSDLDTIYSFFLHCYHLSDWLGKDPKYQHQNSRRTKCSNMGCAKCHVERTPALKLSQELCNGIKHLNPDRPMPGRRMNVVTGEIRFYITWREVNEGGRSSETRASAFEAIEEARNAWKDYIVAVAGVVTSAGEYDRRYAYRVEEGD